MSVAPGPSQKAAPALLRVENLIVEHALGRGRVVQAVSDVSFDLAVGETLALVGESGSGKSSLARAILQVPPPTAGRVIFEGEDLTRLDRRALRRLRPRLQMILQDPIASLNPRRSVGDIVGEALIVTGVRAREERERRVRASLDAVGLEARSVIDRRPHELSGGQCQRVSIARVLVLEPELVICDEPVSALDVSIRAQVLNLIEAMRARYRLTLLFIAHDLAVVKVVSDRVAVMYLGRLCEVGPTERIFSQPAHPYTAALLAAVPVANPDAPPRPAGALGEPASPTAPPSGCRFRTRCPRAQTRCAAEPPVAHFVGPEHQVSCHYPLEVLARQGSEGDAAVDRSAP